MVATNINEYLKEPTYEMVPGLQESYVKTHGKFIYPSGKKWMVSKQIKGERYYYGTYESFADAMKRRDELIAKGWPIPDTYEIRVKRYYRGIHMINNTYFRCSHKDNDYGLCHTIEEALYFRDILRSKGWPVNLKPSDVDLETDNPYIRNGLDYPLPERLKKKPPAKKRKRGLGAISVRGPQSYRVEYGSHGKEGYFGSYRTYEMAYYVRQEMQKCDWDRSQLQRIVDEYPIWYTWLNNFYKYVIRAPDADGKWLVVITPKRSADGKLQQLHFSRLEDALWERDLLIKYDFDEELLIECADDSLNPYYDMELPPYPQRKIRRIQERQPRTELFNKLRELIVSDGIDTLEKCAEIVDLTSVTLRNILKNEYNSCWPEFRNICMGGDDPNEILELQPVIYTPNLERVYENNNYVSFREDLRNSSPYSVYYKGKYFGAYPTKELADKISNDLQKCNWDKSKLESIQAKHGWKSKVGSKRWVYPVKSPMDKSRITSWQVRKKDKNKKFVNYGTYKSKVLAELIRDQLILCNWDYSKLDSIVDDCTYIKGLIDNCWRCKL